MRKFIALLLACLLSLSAALADGAGQRLEAEIIGTRLEEKWDGQASDEYDWLAVDLKLTNWHVDTQRIADGLSGRLVFRDVYAFEGTPAFAEDDIAPLVEKQGALVFRIPKLVSRSLDSEEIALSVTVEGEEIPVSLDVRPAPARRDGRLEGPGFDSPEDAALAYLDAMNRGSAADMLSTFALESWAEHVDPLSSYVRLMAFYYNANMAGPMYSDYARGLMVSQRYGVLAGQLRNQYYELSIRADGEPIKLPDADEAKALMERFAASPVNDWAGHVEFVEWLEPETLSDNFLMLPNQRNIAVQMSCAGVEDYAILAAHIRLNGMDAIQTMSCARYDGRWYNLDLHNNLAMILGMGAYSAGLACSGSEDDPNAARLLASPAAKAEDAELLSTWKTSDLTGTHWRLTALSQPGIQVVASREGIRDDAGMSVWGELRFTRHNGAIADIRFSPALDGLLGEGYGYILQGLVWTDAGGALRLLSSTGVPINMKVDDIACARSGDTLRLSWPDGLQATFGRVED